MNVTRPAVPSDDMALDLSQLLQAIGAALKWLVPLVVIVAGIFFLALQLVPSRYKGEARVLIESTDAQFPGTTRGVEEERALLDAEGVASQVQLLMSADLARRVAKRLDLASVPEFEAARAGSLVDDILAMLGLGQDMSRASVEEMVLKHYYENLQIYRLEGSRVIAVEYSSEDPELAASVANTILDEYISLQTSAKRQSNEVATSAMEPQIEQLRREVQAARKAVEDYRARNDLLIGANNLTLNQQQLGELSSKYSDAHAKKAEAQAKADLIRELLKNGGALDVATDVLNSTLIQRLRERQVAIQSKIAELSITHLPNHPQLKALQSQLADYDRQIHSEARKVLTGLENDAKVASQQAAALDKQLDELKIAAARSNTAQVRLNELERDANAKTAQLDALLVSFQDADMRLRAQVLPADARIISKASVPIEPYAPKVIAITIIAALVTFVLGCAFVIMREFLSGNVLYPIDAEGNPVLRPMEVNMPEPNYHAAAAAADAPSGYAVTGTLSGYNQMPSDLDEQDQTVEPGEAEEKAAEKEARQNAEKPEPAATEEPGMEYDRDFTPDWLPSGEVPEKVDADAESGFDPALLAGAIDGRVVVLSVDEAKTAEELSFILARQAAAAGKAVLFLEIFPENNNPEAAPGFSDLVAGEAAFGKTIYRETQSNVHIIEAGRMSINDAMAESDRFQDVLDAVGKTYDTVVVNLGTIDGSLASAKLLGFADRILVTASAKVYGKELASAANLLAHNTGAVVQIVQTEEMRQVGKKGHKGPNRAA